MLVCWYPSRNGEIRYHHSYHQFAWLQAHGKRRRKTPKHLYALILLDFLDA